MMTRGNDLEIRLITVWPATKERLSSCLDAHWNISVYRPYQFKKGRRFRGKISLLLEEWLNFLKLLFDPGMYGGGRVIACEYCHYSILLFGKWLKLLGIPKRIYLFNFYIHGLGKHRTVQAILKYLLAQDVALMVQSKTELAYFKQLSSSADVRFSPYCRAEITDVNPAQIRLGDYVFAGGYTNRDYDILLRCAERLPELKFMIVCSRLNSFSVAIPANVEILRDIPAQEFHTLMAASRVAVIPLRDDVGSSGQMVAIAAMQFGKTIIYPDFDVISQYFEDKISGLRYRAGDTDSLFTTLSSVFLNQDRLKEIGAKARRKWEAQFRPENFVNAICAHMKSFLGQI